MMPMPVIPVSIIYSFGPNINTKRTKPEKQTTAAFASSEIPLIPTNTADVYTAAIVHSRISVSSLDSGMLSTEETAIERSGVASEKVGEYTVTYKGNSNIEIERDYTLKVTSVLKKWLGKTGYLYRGI